VSWTERLVARFGPDRVQLDAALAPYSTFKIGGPAECLLTTTSAEEVLDGLRIAREAGVPVTVIGGGSNVLISDRGVRGLVIRPRGGGIELIDQARVRADAGVTTNRLIQWTIDRGLAGLETWAGTPGTIGGAVYGNAHFAGRSIGDLIETARIAALDGSVQDIPQAAMDFDYDRSRLQRTKEVLLSAVFRLDAGDRDRLRRMALDAMARRKKTQPLDAVSAGCVFQNPDPALDVLPANAPASAGALIDLAGMKGVALGRARVSPVHANFVVNEGGASARDVCKLINLCRARVRECFGIELREEIVYLGDFEPAQAEES
jgi:UDP-N-acetylmuramate dehydrogenase